MSEMASWIMAPQYAEYQVLFSPNTINKINTMERRKVLRMGFAVGINHTFIYLSETDFRDQSRK